MSVLTWADCIGSAIVLGVMVWMWYAHFRVQGRRLWRCVRYQGGGAFDSPRPMTLEEVTKWLARDINAEIGHVDSDHGFIFYRPKG